MNKVACTPTVGADVEGFLYNSKTGNYVPCVGLVPGTKDEPHQFPNAKKGFCIQEDNVMVEFNIPPARSYKDFQYNIQLARKLVAMKIKEVKPMYQVHYVPDIQFKSAQLLSAQARTIGCDPDFDAYQGGEVRREPPKPGLWRGAGGHIHLGGDFQCPDFVAALFADAVLGISQQMTGTEPTKRDKWYGQPGIFRPKPYGIEWRSASSYWMADSDRWGNIGASSLGLARWLSETDARELQQVFRAVDWTRIHNYLTFGEIKTASRSRERNTIIHALQRAGVPA